MTREIAAVGTLTSTESWVRGERNEPPQAKETATREGEVKNKRQIGTLRMITLNVNGIRQDERKIALGTSIYETKVQIYILTETRLAKSEAREISYPSYVVANDSSLVPDQAKMRA